MDVSSVKVDQADIDKFTAYQKTFFFTKVDGVYPVDILVTHLGQHEPHLRTIFRKKLNAEVTKVTELSRRTLHYVYKVESADGSYIVRINAAGHFYHELSFYTEAWVMRELADRSLPHLNILEIDTSRSLVPFDYEIMDMSQGETLFDISLTNSMPMMVIGQLGAFVASIHEIATRGYGPLTIPSILADTPQGIHDSWLSYIILNMVSHIESCTLLGFITQAEATEIATVLSNVEHIEISQPMFLHGDVANHNTFVKDNKISAIIDWEDCISGDPVYDIAYYGSGCFGYEMSFDAFLTGYKSIRTVPADFDRRYWLYYLRISLVKALVRERFLINRNTYLPDPRARILHALSRAKSVIA
jgi:aminoglycoside phosphotransferase (APT) family kinase protein